MNKEDSLLINSIEDKLSRCLDQNVMTHTAFLDVRQCALAEREFCHTRHFLYGGYEDAERRIMIFLPDYMEVPQFSALPRAGGSSSGGNASCLADNISAAGGTALPWEDEEDDPLCVLRVSSAKGSKPLNHRDYLGALVGLGLDRSVSGDIIVGENGADIIVLKSISEFLLLNYTQAGRVSLTGRTVPVGSLDLGQVKTVEKRDTVASLRLDNLVSSAYAMARGKAQEAISSGLVFVNSLQNTKADFQVKEGDKIVLRGMGKTVLKEVGKTTRKDRIVIVLEKYV